MSAYMPINTMNKTSAASHVPLVAADASRMPAAQRDPAERSFVIAAKHDAQTKHQVLRGQHDINEGVAETLR